MCTDSLLNVEVFPSRDKKQKRSRADYCSKCYKSALHTGWTRVLPPDSSCAEWVRRLLYSSVLHATGRLELITAVKLCGAVCWCRSNKKKKKKKDRPPDAKALECKCVATIWFFISNQDRPPREARAEMGGNILHKWWLIAEAFFSRARPANKRVTCLHRPLDTE